jgi:prephenate dehydrogenase
MKIAVVGIGLIGGSMALGLKAKGHHLIGVDNNLKHAEQAIDFDLVDEIMSLEEAINHSAVIILATPVSHIENLLVKVLDQISWKKIVLDVGSTKRNVCSVANGHVKRGRFVAAHPLAGTEFSGPKAAIDNLFDGKKNIICEEDLVDEDALEITIDLFQQLGMQTLFMNPDDHDKHMAYVSHLSHVSAFMLSQTVLEIEKDQKQIFNLASTGFQSTVRLAKSSPDTWSAIFEKNNDHLSDALGSYIQYLQEFKKQLDKNNTAYIKQQLEHANEIKRVLTGIQLNIVKLS